MKTINGIENCISALKTMSNSRVYMNTKTLTCFVAPYLSCDSYTILESERVIEVCKYNCKIDQLSIEYLKEKVTRSLLNSECAYLILASDF